MPWTKNLTISAYPMCKHQVYHDYLAIDMHGFC